MAATFACKAYGTTAANAPLGPMEIKRRVPTPTDVQIDILYCGICHSDLHTARNEWAESGAPTVYPCVPGHEIVGKVAAVGAQVKKFKVGDVVAVGCLVDSDRTCPNCQKNLEQYCPNMVLTYNSKDKHLGGVTLGGYSESVVVDEAFVLRVPSNLSLQGVAPLVCAGITTYSPMRHWNVTKGKKVGIVGLGGLGHMGVKWAVAMGAHVVVFSRTEGKKESALKLGAHEVCISTNKEDMKKHSGTFDFILDTIADEHDLNAYIQMLTVDGNLTLVGAPPKPLPVAAMGLIFGRRSVSGSLIGGIAETQEMLDFAGKHNITADVEMITVDKVNEAYTRLLKSDVKYRFCIDMKSIKN